VGGFGVLHMMKSRFDSFANWIQYYFSGKETEAESFWAFEGNPFPLIAISYLATLFENPKAVLKAFSDAQINQGLWNIFGELDYILLFRLDSVPWNIRKDCLWKIPNFFIEIFAERCTPITYYDSLSPWAGNPLNISCCMWWDFFRFGKPKNDNLNITIVEICERILLIDSVACREAALHGLGHWYEGFPEKVEKIINSFLLSTSNLPPELIEYAEHAKFGQVL
jgi:hypothetical protein